MGSQGAETTLGPDGGHRGNRVRHHAGAMDRISLGAAGTDL